MGDDSIDRRIQAGATFLIPSGPAGEHLFIVVIAGEVINGKPHLLSVCLCTIRGVQYDNSCVLKIGEHPFAVADSYIAYRHTRSDPVEHVVARLDEGVFISKEPVSKELLRRIKAGLLLKTTPRYIKDDWGLLIGSKIRP